MIAEMNMIPLIDISLILLIIFMVITPALVQSQIKVSLPAASNVSKGTDNDVVKVQLSIKGETAVNGKKINADNLEKELIMRFAKAGDKTLLVEADKDVSVQRVVTVLDTAKKLGAGKIGIAVTPQK